MGRGYPLSADGFGNRALATRTYVDTRRTPDGWPRPPGRLDTVLLTASAFPPAESPTSYVCGPTGFVETVADLLVETGQDPRRVRTERFGLDDGTRKALEARGHVIKIDDGGWGNAMCIVQRTDGVLEGGADPRGEGLALGL